MFKPHVSPRSHHIHPYQTTIVPRSEQQFATASKQRMNYPWSEEVGPIYHAPGTDSSTSDPTYAPHYYNPRDFSPPSPEYQLPYSINTWRNSIRRAQPPLEIPTLRNHGPPETYVFPQCTTAFSKPVCMGDVCPRPQVVGPSPLPPVTPDIPIIGACGGHCPGFEYVCYYVLQVIFVVGILTGISLCIAGMVLRRSNRNGDLGVLVYIGCLSSSVCGVLLGVQSCVRRELRLRRMRALAHIPMQHLTEVPASACPLITNTLPRNQVYRANATTIEEDDTGVPWWRRQQD